MKAGIFRALITAVFSLLITSACKYDKIPIAPDSGIVRTRVIDAMTGPTILYSSPLEAANIYTDPPSVKGLTDKKGEAHLENVPIGWYNVYASKIGYYDSYYNTEVYSQKISDVRILLRPIQKGNTRPIKPFDPFPKDSMKIYSNYISLEWNCSDPDEDLVYYDIFFGRDNPPRQLIRWNNIDMFFQIDTLEPSTVYYWRINSKDIIGAVTIGDIWQFRTK